MRLARFVGIGITAAAVDMLLNLVAPRSLRPRVAETGKRNAAHGVAGPAADPYLIPRQEDSNP
jgi:hypothetical protein